jgi:hypothetical protein
MGVYGFKEIPKDTTKKDTKTGNQKT